LMGIGVLGEVLLVGVEDVVHSCGGGWGCGVGVMRRVDGGGQGGGLRGWGLGVCVWGGVG
jgi:hypothetical protein